MFCWQCTKNHIFYFQKFWKDGLSKKIALEYDLSCIIRDIDIQDWHSRKSYKDSLYFYRDLHRRFYVLLSSKKKKQGNLIYRKGIWLLFKFIWLEIFYNEESSIICTIQPSGVVLRGMHERQLRKLSIH